MIDKRIKGVLREFFNIFVGFLFWVILLHFIHILVEYTSYGEYGFWEIFENTSTSECLNSRERVVFPLLLVVPIVGGCWLWGQGIVEGITDFYKKHKKW